MPPAVVDVWWGWLDAGFRAWLKEKYPWIRLVYVPGNCTSVAQPLDAGIIAMMKALLRKLYGKWVISLVQQQLDSGVSPAAVKVPMGVPECKANLIKWLSDIR